MRKSLGSKRNEMDENDISTITRTFGAFEIVDARELDKPIEQKSNRGRQSANPKNEMAKTFASKIFSTHEFGYRRITIERPLRESYQFSDERIAECRFATGALNAAMKSIYAVFGEDLSEQADIRAYLKLHFADLKEKQIKDVLEPKLWEDQKIMLAKATALQNVIGAAQYDDMNGFDDALKVACKKADIVLDAKEKKQIKDAVSWRNPLAEKVIKKMHKTPAKPLYGLFEVDGAVIEYQADSELRDNENVALDPTQTVNDINEAYFIKEVLPHVADAWIDESKRDDKDGEIGIVGYEIPFNRHFYQYQPPRDLVEIDADLDAVSAEIMALLQEVHS
jgi:type I restriction enzyme M protein